jgi:hypothetical protein
MSLPAPISSRRGRQAVDLAWEVTKLNCRSPITINAELIAAYQAASSPHSLRALASDIEAFDHWCRRNGPHLKICSPDNAKLEILRTS